ncbi:MAG TPA: PfkB family carbohydrate kinase [Methylomirabilota bacterium]|nr:PfkB family carbohydrate kinase [Methylomirabilota bacterium]
MGELVVVGSVALDSVKTPFGAVEDALGGSATYFSYSASFFTKVRLVAVVGKDFSRDHLSRLEQRGVDLSGLQISEGQTFRWVGEYGYDLNEAHTLATHLNVFADFKPDLPQHYRSAPLIFLANIDPVLQREVLRQMKRPHLVALDTMNFWINGKRDALLSVLAEVDALVINDGEARMLTKEPNLIKAARTITSYGPKIVVIKRGEYGALMISNGRFFFTPAYPLESVFDPTGAGDTFAGGFMGMLAKSESLDEAALRRAIVYGSVMASFTVEDFSLNRLMRLEPEEIEARVQIFRDLVHFEI